jgi:hypothetical protein
LGLHGELAKEWQQYISNLKMSAKYMAKLHSKAIMKEIEEGEKQWWWRPIWKLKCPLKLGFLMVGTIQ